MELLIATIIILLLIAISLLFKLSQLNRNKLAGGGPFKTYISKSQLIERGADNVFRTSSTADIIRELMRDAVNAPNPTKTREILESYKANGWISCLRQELSQLGYNIGDYIQYIGDGVYGS